MTIESPENFPPLPPPAEWMEEISRRLGNPVPPTSPVELDVDVALSYFKEAEQKQGWNAEDVESELARGFHLHASGAFNGGKNLILSTRRYVVSVGSREGKNSGAQLATIQRVERVADQKLLDAPLIPVSLTLSPVWDEKPCDLGEIFRLYRDEVGERRKAFDALRLKLDSINQPAQLVGALEHKVRHGRLLKRYGALRTLIQLLFLRAQNEIQRAKGVVTALGGEGERGFLTLRIDGAVRLFDTQNRVSISNADRTRVVRTRVEEVDGDLVYLPKAEDGMFALGEDVELSLQPQFGMRSHSEALRKLLEGEVEGDWGNLVRMLASPKTLRAPSAAVLRRHFAGAHLNEEQKRAVAGACSTPHAFFIQGPPGTGKTTVIVEIVQQLVARGERVLLLAPTHVAVDEVLRRVGHMDGVLPIRLAWNDMKVQPDVRQYTQSHVRSELAKKVRRPSSSRAKHWAKEREELQAHLTLLSGWKQSLGRRAETDRAVEQFAAEVTQQRQTKADAERLLQVACDETRAAEQNLEVQRHRLGQCHDRLALAQSTVQQLAPRSVLDAVKGFFSGQWRQIGAAKRAFARAQQAEAEAKQSEADAAASVGRLTARQQSIVRDLEAIQRKLSELNPQLSRAQSASLEAEQEVRSKMRAAAQALLGHQSDSEETRAELKRIDAQIRHRSARLEALPELEHKWFQLSGLAREESHAAMDSFMEQIGDDLMQAVNVVCCTTTGIAAQDFVRQASFDTLIVDEASRVTDSEFLIGATRARRWILVGDENQLPPYVEQRDEFFLHALTALHRASRSPGNGLDAAVDELAEIWAEEEELHRYRREAVIELAQQLQAEGQWERLYREPFEGAHRRFRTRSRDDPDRELLKHLRDFLVRSLFERCVQHCPSELRQRLVVQRRMIAPLAGIVREPIYHGDYVTPSGEENEAAPRPLIIPTFQRPVVFLDTSLHGRRSADEQAGNGFICSMEQDWVVSVCQDFERELAQRKEKISASILAFYRSQAKGIQRKLGWPRFENYRHIEFRVIDAIDKIQGQESDLGILTFGRALLGRSPTTRYGQWLQDLRRLNVACTRARRGLVLVGHQPTLQGLCSSPEAQNFFRNLFVLFSSDAEHFVNVKAYKPAQAPRPAVAKRKHLPQAADSSSIS